MGINAEYMGTVVDLPHKQLNMKVMGFVVLALACCLLSVSGAPAPLVDPVSVAFTAAGGLVLTAGTATATIPTPPCSPARPSSSRGSSSTSSLPSRLPNKEEESIIKMSKSYHRL